MASSDWAFLVDKPDVTVGEPLYWLKETFKAAGWTIKGSSDGTTSGAGDVITSPGTAAGGMTRLRAWFVVRDPSGVELCFQQSSISGSASGQRIKRSQSAGFTLPSPAPNTVPSASDEEFITSGGTDASPGALAMFETTGRRIHAGVSKVAPFSFFVIACTIATTSVVDCGYVYDGGLQGTDPNEDQKWLLYRGVTLIGNQFLEKTEYPGFLYATSSVGRSRGLSDNPIAIATISGDNMVSPYDGRDIERPMFWKSTAPFEYHKGVGTIMRWHFPRIGTNNKIVSLCLVDDEPRIIVGHVSLPWPDMATVPTGVSVTPGTGLGRFYPDISAPGPPPDVDPPVIANVVPAPESALSAAAAVAFDVTDESGIASVLVTVAFANGTVLTAYDGTAFAAPFAGASTIDTIADGYAFTVAHNGGWPSATLDFRVHAFDASGNATHESFAYTVTNPKRDDIAPPVIANISPAPGQPIFATSATSFDVTDDIGLRRVAIYDYHAGYTDVVFDGVAFQGPYVGSRQTPITNGYRFQIMRRGGWVEAPRLAVYPTDTSGNEAP